MNRTILKGIPVSPGIAIGPGFVSDTAAIKIPVYRLKPAQVAGELKRFEQAIEDSKIQLLNLRQEMEKRLGSKDAMIFTVHIQLIEDSSLREKVEDKIRDELINIEAAIKEVIDWFAIQIKGLNDSAMSDKSADIRDVGNRLIRNLLAFEKCEIFARTRDFILVTREFLPSDTAHIDTNRLAAIVTEVGGMASHAAILARSMGIPAVTGVVISELPTKLGEVIVDGRGGTIIIHPNRSDKTEYQSKRELFIQFKEQLQTHAHEEPITQDGTSIEVLTNIENFEDINPVDYETLSGIGLYRTEYIFMNRNAFPSEDEQYQIYRSILERIGPDKNVTFRTIDVGGDKKLPYFKTPEEANPVLGWRGVRIYLEWPDIFLTQIRALMRASVHGRANIMLPMITNLEEVRLSKAYFLEMRDDLRKKYGSHISATTQLGIMVEVPAAAWEIKNIAMETDFISIGTNDLIQYILAVDRNNARVAQLYQPLSPAVLKVIHHVIQAGKEAGKNVSICGEMAGNFKYTQLLLGMGLRRFSMAPFYVNGVKQVLRASTIADAERVAGRALNMKTIDEIRNYLKRMNPLNMTVDAGR